MADQTNQTPGRHLDDEPDRPKAARGVSLAEEGSDDLPALLVIAVGIAVIVVLLLQSGLNVPGLTTTATTGSATATPDAEDGAEDGAEDEEETTTTETTEAEDLDAAAITAQLAAAGFDGVDVAVDGADIVATGEVADDAARAEIMALLEALPGVGTVTDEMTIAAPASAEVTLTASQASLVLAGTVPSQAVADELATRAAAIYAADQIDNQLVVDAAAQPPIVVTITGSTTDQALFDRLTNGFTGIVGIDTINTEGLALEQSSDLEASLLALPAIQFASGSAVILPESATILDQAAVLLQDSPGTAIEIGGHTDSRGSTESNQALSQARADAVLAALIERGLVNDMQARGFGESRLKVTPDDTPEAQQTNRRIEFRIL